MIRLEGAGATEAFGHALGERLATGDVVALFGDLGAGKTTLSRGILRGLGFEGEVASPSFPIVLPYGPPDTRIALTHVDLYRIEDPAELEELALDEARTDTALLIEWPERLGDALWADALQLHLVVAGENARALTVKVPTAWEERWPPR